MCWLVSIFVNCGVDGAPSAATQFSKEHAFRFLPGQDELDLHATDSVGSGRINSSIPGYPHRHQSGSSRLFVESLGGCARARAARARSTSG
jgi:hypothetical protein